jgi:hypothetical protein
VGPVKLTVAVEFRHTRHDLRKQKLCPHAELVRKKRLPKAGGIMMDSPPYDSMQPLQELARYFPPIHLEAQRDARDTMGGVQNLRHWARAERLELAWRAVDTSLRPDYGDSDDDTDEECDATTGELIDDAEKSLLSAEAKAVPHTETAEAES